MWNNSLSGPNPGSMPCNVMVKEVLLKALVTFECKEWSGPTTVPVEKVILVLAEAETCTKGCQKKYV